MAKRDLTTWRGVACALESHLQSEALAETSTNYWVTSCDEASECRPADLDESLVHVAISEGRCEGTMIRVLVQKAQGDPLIPVLIAKSLASPRGAVADLLAILDWVTDTTFSTSEASP